ncbi:MAG TPA: UbiD family decarboxylase, partial [Chitinophagaceae bacterium]|nr:UbiD family decarboxylase [Chitinophagaceae bacterium]
TQQPPELLTIANHILGTGQLSLAKYLWITADEKNVLHTHSVSDYMQFVLERIQWQRDVHFITNTSIDTLDYSGSGLNMGSKVTFAAYGEIVRELVTEIPSSLTAIQGVNDVSLCMTGVIALQLPRFTNYEHAKSEIYSLSQYFQTLISSLSGVAMFVICDDAPFLAQHINNYVWVTYTRSNPAKDIYGVNEFTQDKHWGCHGPLIIDARSKPHHAPVLEKDPAIERNVDLLFQKGGVLSPWG